MRAISTLAKALSDEGRLRVLLALREQELCVCQITALLQLAMPTVSRHMAVLQQAGLVTSRKSGRWVYYRLTQPPADSPAATALQWVFTTLADHATATADSRKLRTILACDPEDICRQQRG